MNNYNIHLEIQNPKKQAIGTKLEAMACYLMNRRTEEQRNESWGTTGNHLGLGFVMKCSGRAMVERRWMAVRALGHELGGAAVVW